MLWTVALTSFLAASGTCAVVAQYFPPVTEERPVELLQPKPPRVQATHNLYSGRVTAVGHDWLELGAGWMGSESKRKQWTGANEKPKKLSASGTIPGGDPDGQGQVNSYRLIDLKLGDVVGVETGISLEGEEWVTSVIILRRPKGKIPPRPGQAQFPLVGNEDHLRMQAEQDWEERGIPIPMIFLDPWGRCLGTNPPYPPVAPLPRPKGR